MSAALKRVEPTQQPERPVRPTLGGVDTADREHYQQRMQGERSKLAAIASYLGLTVPDTSNATGSIQTTAPRAYTPVITPSHKAANSNGPWFSFKIPSLKSTFMNAASGIQSTTMTAIRTIWNLASSKVTARKAVNMALAVSIALPLMTTAAHANTDFSFSLGSASSVAGVPTITLTNPAPSRFTMTPVYELDEIPTQATAPIIKAGETSHADFTIPVPRPRPERPAAATTIEPVAAAPSTATPIASHPAPGGAVTLDTVLADVDTSAIPAWRITKAKNGHGASLKELAHAFANGGYGLSYNLEKAVQSIWLAKQANFKGADAFIAGLKRQRGDAIVSNLLEQVEHGSATQQAAKTVNAPSAAQININAIASQAPVADPVPVVTFLNADTPLNATTALAPNTIIVFPAKTAAATEPPVVEQSPAGVVTRAFSIALAPVAPIANAPATFARSIHPPQTAAAPVSEPSDPFAKYNIGLKPGDPGYMTLDPTPQAAIAPAPPAVQPQAAPQLGDTYGTRSIGSDPLPAGAAVETFTFEEWEARQQARQEQQRKTAEAARARPAQLGDLDIPPPPAAMGAPVERGTHQTQAGSLNRTFRIVVDNVTRTIECLPEACETAVAKAGDVVEFIRNGVELARVTISDSEARGLASWTSRIRQEIGEPHPEETHYAETSYGTPRATTLNYDGPG